MRSTEIKENSDNLYCPQCNTVLQLYEKFCGSCGEQVSQKKTGEGEKHTEKGDDDAQEYDADTVVVAGLSQKHFKRWQMSQSLKNNGASGQPHISNHLSEDIEAAKSLMASSPETEISQLELADTQTQLEVPTQHELLQSLPATPDPAVAEKLPHVPTTEAPVFLGEDMEKNSKDSSMEDRERVRKVASNPSKANWLWPAIIMFSTVAAGVVTFMVPSVTVRPFIVMWFLFTSPGMALVRFLRLNVLVVEWTLAFALSFAIDAIVAGILLYAGRWSPTGTLGILMGISLGGAIMQIGFCRKFDEVVPMNTSMDVQISKHSLSTANGDVVLDKGCD